MMSLTFGLFIQVSGSGPLGPLVYFNFDLLILFSGIALNVVAAQLYCRNRCGTKCCDGKK